MSPRNVSRLTIPVIWHVSPERLSAHNTRDLAERLSAHNTRDLACLPITSSGSQYP
ncbi:hypothetical protein F511_46998 [Dorcoceras hygrometricum]|uniref:Uncharacterized protein n=1 Tax=Dorcoceras hygrometricum TaxID=472368 RepID=A0A2Z6ZS29_9LAMI|nr:hypothetical protein F511_46998 [Dorcoceras hygrometricum]